MLWSRALTEGLRGFMANGVVIIAFLSIVQDVHALRTNLRGGAGAEYSNNIRRTDTNQVEDLIGTGLIGFTLDDDSGPVVGEVSADLRYEDFVNDTYDDRFLLSLFADGEWRISPDRLSWILQNNFTQLPVDSVDPITPDNIQNSNAFTTGPDAFFRFGLVSRLELGARFEDARFESSSESDSKRYSAFAKWIYVPTSARELSLNIDAEGVDFEENVSDANFIREDYSLALLTRTARTELRIEGGGTSIQRQRSENFNGPLLEVSWNWRPTRLSALDFLLASRITDSGSNILTATPRTDQQVLQTEQVSPDLFREKRIELTYGINADRLSADLSTYWIERDYEIASLDEEDSGLFATMNYRLMPSVAVSLNGGVTTNKLFTTQEQNDDYLIGSSLAYLFTRDLTLQLFAAYFKRNSNQFGAGYDEFRVFFGLFYGFGEISGAEMFSGSTGGFR